MTREEDAERLLSDAFCLGREAELAGSVDRLESISREYGGVLARLLALLAPEPEPSEQEIEAGAKARWTLVFGNVAWDRATDALRTMYREEARVVIAAARAARQTGGEGE